MINDAYKAMLAGKSVIRELNEYANDITAHPHLRPEDIFDFSLGNPSVPVPDAFNLRIKELLDHGDPMLVHGYSPSLGIPSCPREDCRIAEPSFRHELHDERHLHDQRRGGRTGACLPAGHEARRRHSRPLRRIFRSIDRIRRARD